MKTYSKWLLVAALFGWLGPVHAMRFLVQENRLFASGTVEPGDPAQLQALLATHKATDEIVLIDVSGQALASGLEMARQVAARGLQSTVVGYCMAACAPIFLAGKERRFATGEHPRRTLVGLQGAWQDKTGKVDALLNQQWMAFLKERLGSRFDEPLMRQALEQGADAGGYLRVRETGRTVADDRKPFFCASGQTLVQECVIHAGKDALSLGISTVAETASLTLPGSFVPAPEFFGKTLTAPTPDFTKVLEQQGLAMCGANAACVQRWEAALPVYSRQKSNRATALGAGKPGLAFSDDQETVDLAAKRAIFLCNHVAGNKKFCHAAAVNDYDLEAQYTLSREESLAAIAGMKRPAVPVWEGEEVDRGVATPLALRMRDLQSPTPLALPGARTWNTGELADAVKSGSAAVIDVAGAAEGMLPSAIHLWEGGLALADATADAAYDQRFRDMLELAAPAKDRPVVFYCRDADCWAAANAAMRAVKAGYTQVGWYRGGLASWTKAGLPLARKVPLAVIN